LGVRRIALCLGRAWRWVGFRSRERLRQIGLWGRSWRLWRA